MHPAVRHFVREGLRTFASLAVYCAALGLLAYTAKDLFIRYALDQPVVATTPAPEWVETARGMPAFKIEMGDFFAVEPRAQVRRHGHGGGRQDVLIWDQTADGLTSLAVAFYRPGIEDERSESPLAMLIAGVHWTVDPPGTEPYGSVGSKFGPFDLFRLQRNGPGSACIGFARAFAEPAFSLAGVLCGPDADASGRGVIACALDRLSLVSAGGDAKLARLFARADLKRTACTPGHPPAIANTRRVDWLDGAQTPTLRKGGE